jgi:hypothetical protein
MGTEKDPYFVEHNQELKKSIKPYPNQDRDILLSWNSRQKEFDWVYNSVMGRRQHCETYLGSSRSPAVCITKDSILGECTFYLLRLSLMTYENSDLDLTFESSFERSPFIIQ